jgi:hypothetical protein
LLRRYNTGRVNGHSLNCRELGMRVAAAYGSGEITSTSLPSGSQM